MSDPWKQKWATEVVLVRNVFSTGPFTAVYETTGPADYRQDDKGNLHVVQTLSDDFGTEITLAMHREGTWLSVWQEVAEEDEENLTFAEASEADLPSVEEEDHPTPKLDNLMRQTDENYPWTNGADL